MVTASVDKIYISYPPIAKVTVYVIIHTIARSQLTAHTTFELSHHIVLLSTVLSHSSHEMVLNSIFTVKITPPFLNCRVYYFQLAIL